MRSGRVQLFSCLTFLLLPGFSGQGEPLTGQTYSVHLSDVDGHTLSTADGHVTVLAICKVAQLDKAHALGDRVPQYCLGNPTYRFITVVEFQKSPGRASRLISTLVARHRLDVEARALQARYAANKIGRDARRDVFAVLDFDGKAAAGLDISAALLGLEVLVLGGKGVLLQRWTNVPSPQELDATLKP